MFIYFFKLFEVLFCCGREKGECFLCVFFIFRIFGVRVLEVLIKEVVGIGVI